MPERVVYLNGEFVPESQAAVSFLDRGFLFGDAAYDVGRTFAHKPFKLEAHTARLLRSLKYMRIDPRLSAEEISKLTLRVIETNLPGLDSRDDFTFHQRISRGLYTTDNPLAEGSPTVILYCQPVRFGAFARAYTEGIHVVISSTRRIPPQCIDPRVKIHNKANHILADMEARTADPKAYSLMLDVNGHLAESASANLFLVRQGKLLTPGKQYVLEGISRETVAELAGKLGIPVEEGELTVYDLLMAEEAFLTTTSPCLLPVGRVNGTTLPRQVPGPVTARLLQAWSDLVGVDLVQQALRHL